jgi:PPOX class probable FMN-dependent enzyme
VAASLSSVADLRTLYPDPGARGQAKVITALDDNCRAYLAHCPFVVVATADGAGRCDASPKGGTPGFIHVLDDSHLAWADMSGNNRLDSFQNIVDNQGIGLLCIIPGLDETLRINGTATLSTDGALCEQLAIDGKVAKVAVIVTVDEAYIHCAKAFRRGGVWRREQWPDRSDMPTIACILRDHTEFDGDVAAVQARLDSSYERTMWEPGGAELTT